MSQRFPIEKLPPLDLGRWRNVPDLLIAVGALAAVVGLEINPQQFGFSWLLAFMFCLSIALGALFLVLVHHLSDAGWSVPIRRFCEHLACLLFPALAVMFVPVALLAKKIYPWLTADPHANMALRAKQPVFTQPMFLVIAAIFFAVWWALSHQLRKWSLKQDETGAVECTRRLRFHSAWGIFAYGITLTLAAIFWMKSLQQEWFSAMYGVYFFGSSTWVTLATVYFITVLLARAGGLCGVLHKHQFYYLGTLLLAFTVFQAYISFAQYFVIWNANMPVETFWYLQREHGSWWWVGMVLIFGHFLVPFLLLLRIDAKENFRLMLPLAGWCWLMHYLDLAFNILPVLHPEGFPLRWVWLDFGCLALMTGVLAKIFLSNFSRSAPYPVKDPRLAEAMGRHEHVPTSISGGNLDEVEQFADGPAEGGKP